MNCQEDDQRLGDYVDGTLTADAAGDVQAHLATCARCRVLVADFQIIRSMTLALPPEVPSPQVWTRLSAAIEAKPRRWGFLSGVGFGWETAAAGAMAIVLTTGLAWIGNGLSPLRLQPAGTAPATAAAATGADGGGFVNTRLQNAEEDFTTAISGLEQITTAERGVLDPETADVLQVNLTTLDAAIVESRAALQTEPDSDVAQESLFAALRTKVVLLQDTLALINEMRKGNPDGAARIISDVNQ